MLFGDFLVGYFTMLEDELYVVINVYKFTTFDCDISYYCMSALSLQIESTKSMIIINDLGFYHLMSVVLGVKHGLIVMHVHLCHQSVHVAMGRL